MREADIKQQLQRKDHLVHRPFLSHLIHVYFAKKKENGFHAKTTNQVTMVSTLVKCVTKPAESTTKEVTQRKNDERLMREVNGVDLLAREACYHHTCRREYTRCVGPQNPDTQPTENAKRLEAH